MDNLYVLIAVVREYLDQDQELPVDLYMELNKEGIKPEQLVHLINSGISDEDIVSSYYN